MALLLEDRQKQILYLAVAVVGLVVWTLYFFIPQRRVWAQNYTEVMRLKEKVSRTRQALGRLPVLEAERARLLAQVRLPVSPVLPQEQLPALLEEIAQAARRAGVRIVSLRPEQEFSRLPPGVSGYLELPIGLRAECGYHALGRLIDLLESSERLLRVQSFSVTSGFQDPWHHQADLRLVAYLAPMGSREQ